jgi:acyl-coenzyme A synthetase/AMP-(fatty) acid ligase
MPCDPLFLDQIEKFGKATAILLEEGRSVSYEDLTRSANRLGAHLKERNLAFLLAENSEESLAGYVAMLRARVPVALLSASLGSAALAELLAVYRPRSIWLPRAKAGPVSLGTEIHGEGRYVLLDTGAEHCTVHPDLALLMTTSGSTGSPKFVRQSYRNIEANTRSIVEYLDILPVDRAITVLPMNYVFGLSIINSHLARGASLILTDRGLMEKGFWDLLKAHQATSLSGVPYTYQMLKQLRFSRMNLPHLKTLTQAGGKLGADLAQEFASICRDKQMKFFIMYGAAEATARMSYLPPELALEKPGSIGRPIPGGAFAVVDEENNEIGEAGVSGELLYRGDNVTMGYATCQDDLARGDDNRGVLRTGDIAQRDADGFYYIVGRKSRFLKIFGNRVNLEDVEQHLRKQGIDNACTGEDDKVRIFVTKQSDVAEAEAAVQQLTGLHHSAFSIVAIAEIPRTEFGKIVYSALLG